MREIRIGKPTVTPEGRAFILKALDEGRVSEGYFTEKLEATIQEKLNVKHAVLVNSGHSALVIAYQAARDLRGVDEILTTPMTFISTVSAALEVGLRVTCLDIGTNLQIDEKIAWQYFFDHVDGRDRRLAYVPVHLFGYPCPSLRMIRESSELFQIDDACEAFGSRRAGGKHLGTEGDIGCFSFYTSHVLGAGEMGCVVTDQDDLASYLRRAKDQGRAHLRPTNHIEQMTSVDPASRYHHSILGWNFRTTDIQAALVLGAMPHLSAILMRRRGVVSQLNHLLRRWKPRISVPFWDPDVSYLGYPIVCGDKETRDLLMFGLDRRGIETRPLMSYLPEEAALKGKLCLPHDQPTRARDIHSRGLYISCHDSLGEDDINYIGKSFDEVLS